eukprot:1281463-Amphidinium_carterae.2
MALWQLYAELLCILGWQAAEGLGDLGRLNIVRDPGSRAARTWKVPLSPSSCSDRPELALALQPLDCKRGLDTWLSALEGVQSSGREEEAEKLAEAKWLAAKLFNVPSKALRSAVKKTQRGSMSRESVSTSEAQGCQSRFIDVGSVMRCFVQERLLFLALSLADEFLAENHHAVQNVDTAKDLKRTYILVQFGQAYLTDLMHECVTSTSAAARKTCASRYLDFSVTAGDLHMFTAQLGQLLLFAYDRMVQLDPDHAEHYMVMVDASPRFAVVTLDPKSDTRFSYQLHHLGYWEPGSTALLERTLARSRLATRVVVDVGANLGWFTLLAASKGASVIAFEPVPQHCRKLEQSVALNQFADRVVLVERAVARKEDEMKLHVFEIGPSPTAYVTETTNRDDAGTKPSNHDLIVQTIQVDAAVDA